MTTPVGIVVHHTASSAKAVEANVVAMCIRGVAKVPGPLYNYLIGRDGTVYSLTADGLKANHAGRGNKSVLDRMMRGQPVLGKAATAGKISANARLVGVSIINDGVSQEIPDAQYEACIELCASLCEQHNLNPLNAVIGHSEWTSRKVDPTFSMVDFRAAVTSMSSHPDVLDLKVEKVKKPQVKPIRASEAALPYPGLLKRGSRSESVKFVQRRVGAVPDGHFGRRTGKKVKEWQAAWNRQAPHTSSKLQVDGVVGRITWGEMQFKQIDLEWAPNFFT
jgi:peptidoglycan hydrolase-like protein with peptidoglycan-binding domain